MRKPNNELSVYAEISRIYKDPAADSSVPPLVQVDFLFENGRQAQALLPSDQLTGRSLTQAVPRLRGLPNLRSLIRELNTQFSDIMETTGPDGLLLPHTGLHRLPDGQSLYVLGDQLIGSIPSPVYLHPPVAYRTIIAPVRHPLATLFSKLCFASPVILLTVIFLFTTLLRSRIRETRLSWQAVLNIVGKQGLGKTTLARLLTDWICDSQGNPTMLYSAGSTPSAIHNAMVNARDLPLVIDDLCLSASPRLQQKYRDSGAQFVREGTNASRIAKKSGNQTVMFSCNAGVILTAEFVLENASDITRCIFAPLDRIPHIPDSLTPEQIGAGCYALIRWFLTHETEVDEAFREAASKEKPDHTHARILSNFTILYTVGSLALRAACEDGLSETQAAMIRNRWYAAYRQSYQYQQKLLDDLDRHRKKGNLAAVLLECYQDPEVFHLAKSVKKIDKHDGIIWKGDLCLRRSALERAVRLQDGYHDYTINQIVRELRDIGALVIQEEGTAQVHIKKNVPRMYRILLSVLDDCAQSF